MAEVAATQRASGTPLLDDPVWAALAGRQSRFAVGNERVRRFSPDIAPFAGMADTSAASFDALRAGIEAESFSPQPADSRRIGAEVEFLVADESDDRPVPLLEGRRGLIAILRRHADALRWRELAGYGRVPRFETSNGAIISFEPGGQIEISSAPADGASESSASGQDLDRDPPVTRGNALPGLLLARQAGDETGPQLVRTVHLLDQPEVFAAVVDLPGGRRGRAVHEGERE